MIPTNEELMIAEHTVATAGVETPIVAFVPRCDERDATAQLLVRKYKPAITKATPTDFVAFMCSPRRNTPPR